MKRLPTLKLIFGLVMVGLLASALAVSLFFGSPDRSHAASNNSPEGSWLLNVTLTSSHPPVKFQALQTYDSGGGLVVTDQTDFNPNGLRSPGHGAWLSTGEGHFATTWLAFFFDAKGNPAGMVKVREVDTLSVDGNSFSGTATVTAYNANGKPVFSGTSKEQGKRILVEGA